MKMNNLKRVGQFLWKWLFCRWFHDKHRCFPEVWDRGLDGPWHCCKCHPCSEGLEIALEEMRKNEKLDDTNN